MEMWWLMTIRAGDRNLGLSGATSAALSPDGRILALEELNKRSPEETDTVTLWQIKPFTHKPEGTGTLTGHKGSILAMAFSPDGKLVTGSAIRLSDCGTCHNGSSVQLITADDCVIAGIPNNKRLWLWESMMASCSLGFRFK